MKKNNEKQNEENKKFFYYTFFMSFKFDKLNELSHVTFL